jgi:acyl-CoA synthetase (AMP-forming)/AMP-acid ligase II
MSFPRPTAPPCMHAPAGTRERPASTGDPPSDGTIVARLWRRAARTPERVAYRYLRETGRNPSDVRELPAQWRRAVLATGDLGSLDRGELFVTGRSKEVIIHRGRNLYPQDVDRILEQLLPCAAMNAWRRPSKPTGRSCGMPASARRGPG